MKSSTFMIFLTIVLIIYSAINFYIGRRGWAVVAGLGSYRYIFLGIFLFLVLAYPVGRWAESLKCCGWTQTLVLIGSFYLGIMVYSFLLVLLIDILRLTNHFVHYFPSALSRNPQKTAYFAGIAVTGIVLITVLFGYINAIHPKIRTLRMTVNKQAGDLKSLNIVMASDIHLGTVIRNDRLLHIVEKMNSLNPDIVLLPGDVVDEDIAPVVQQNMAASLRMIRSKYGTFASTGNHEYIGGVKKAVAYIETGDITMLQDKWVKIAGAFYVIGRKDLMAKRMRDGRKSLDEIMQGVDHSYPLILMDHEPFGLDTARQNGIDLQVSGHTHHGQIFPFNLITKKIYELSWGYMKRENTHYYVSCGVGTWGPPVRTGNTPEIVQIILTFKEDS